MTVQRCAASPRTSLHQIIFNLASTISCTSTSTCRSPLYTSRPFTSAAPLRLSSRRKLQTATAYRPQSQSLPVPAPPPRNVGVPESSIASAAVPAVNDIRPPPPQPPPPPLPSLPSHSQSGVTASHPEQFSSSLPPSTTQTITDERDGEPTSAHPKTISEGEAQISRPVDNPRSSTATIPSSPPPSLSRPNLQASRSRLRPRKAAMALTPSAVAQLRDILARPDPKLIRVGVKNRGCSGLAYHLEYVDRAGAFDETVEQDGVRVLIDSKALFSIIGSEMDWVEDKLSQRFVFRNPNIKEQCGCGESFMV